MTDLRPLNGIAQIQALAPEPDQAPPASTPPPPPADPPAQEAPMADQPADQPALLERLQEAAKARGLAMVAIYRQMGSSSSLGSLLRHGKAGPAQLAKVRAWLDGTWAGMSAATTGDAKAIAQAVTTTKAKRRRLTVPAVRPVLPAAGRQYLVDIAAILGIRPVTVYLVSGDRLVESQALPVGPA